MHFAKAILFTAIAAVASAQNLAGLPACAQTCALSAISSTGCSLTDFKCICASSAYLAGINQCIDKSCSAADIATTLSFAQQLCAQAGVSLTLPASGTVASSAAGAAATAASSAAQTTAAATTSTSKTTVSTAASATGSSSDATGLRVAKFLGAVAGVAGLVLAV